MARSMTKGTSKAKHRGHDGEQTRPYATSRGELDPTELIESSKGPPETGDPTSQQD